MEQSQSRMPLASSDTDQRHARTARAVMALLAPSGKRAFAVRLWNGEVLPPDTGSPAPYTIVLTHPGALRRMFLPPGELTLAEAFLRGDFEIEGDTIAALGLAAYVNQFTAKDWLTFARLVLSLPQTAPPVAYQDGRQAARLRGMRHSRARDRAAVTYHYDVGNAFYALFLGKWMAYSCAYFRTPEDDLDTAQEAKLAHICRKLRLKPGERLLDIGCGWGGLVVYAAQHYGVQAVGINLSKLQIAYAQGWIQRAGVADRARVEYRDYRDLDPNEPFDKIVSVGMFEHVGRKMLRAYFEAAYRVLRPGGLFLNHGISAQYDEPGWLASKVFQVGQFTQRYVFPDGELVPIGEAMRAAELAGFEPRDLESLREHYALTLRHWVRNLEANREEAIRLTDPRTYRVWRLYMAAAAVGFDVGSTNVYQMLLSRSRNSRAELPLTREDLYAA
ncbi:MAG: class I SAM-dependent methyltransferase [Anaerolineae bacterium]